MLKPGSSLVLLSYLGLGAFSPTALAARPQPGEVGETRPASGAVQRLMQMFSPQIQTTISACWNQGKVDLAAGARQDGSITCGDGSSSPNIAYADYVNTVSDILAASSLIGFRAVITSDPRVSPQVLTSFFSNSQGAAILRTAVQTAITQSDLLPSEATESNNLLTERVIEKLLPNLQNPDRFNTLLGSPEQYSQVVTNFCTAPGMSIEDAITLTPNLDSIQLYAICIQESGVTDEILRLVQ